MSKHTDQSGVKSFTLAIGLWIVWASLHLLCSYQLTEVSHQLTLNFGLDPWGSFWVTQGRQWTYLIRFWQSFGQFGSLWHKPEHTWWNGLSLPEHFLPGPSQAPDTSNQGGPTLEDVWPWCSGGGLFAAWLWKQDMGDISQHAPLPVQPCEAKRTCHAWDPTCVPGPGDQPHHGILLEQSPCRLLVISAEGGSSLILLVWPLCIVYPF